jgi:predicted RNase H-like HicB family nuclease
MPQDSVRLLHVAIMKGEGGYYLANVMELSHVFHAKSLSELAKAIKDVSRSALQTWAAHIHIPEFIELKKVRIRLRKESPLMAIRLKEGGYLFSPSSPNKAVGTKKRGISRLEFHVAILKGEREDYSARVAELPGFVTQKNTLSELDKEIRETIPFLLEAEAHFVLPEFIKLKKVRI